VKSIVHPAGFRKVRLLSFAGYHLRLHVWRGGAHTKEDPHQHRWTLVSLPIWGRFKDSRWKPATGNDYARYCATSAGKTLIGDHYENNLQLIGSDSVSLYKSYIRFPLVPYFCDSNAIHTFEPIGNGFHATIVFTGKSRTSLSTVWKSKEK
jgi:hypothetical protein